MLNENTLFLDMLTYASGVVGVILLLAGLFKSHLRFLILIGLALPSGVLAISFSQKVPLMFDVVIVEQAESGISWRKVRQFTGGEYTFRSGRTAEIAKPAGGPIGTVVINDSNRRLRVIRVFYTATPHRPGPGGREEIAVIDSGKTAATLKRVEHFGPESEGPPPSIKSATSFDSLDWLTW